MESVSVVIAEEQFCGTVIARKLRNPLTLNSVAHFSPGEIGGDTVHFRYLNHVVDADGRGAGVFRNGRLEIHA